MPRLAAVLLLIAYGIIATPIAHAGEEFTERFFPVPGHGAFTIWVPESWRHETVLPWIEAPIIKFLPAHGQGFRILITPAWAMENAEAGYDSPSSIRARVEDAANAAQKSAAEERIQVVPIDDVTGFYFSATDASLIGRTPPPGEYRHMTQGILTVGDLLCFFTVLSNYPDDPAALFLTALGTATHRIAG